MIEVPDLLHVFHLIDITAGFSLEHYPDYYFKRAQHSEKFLFSSYNFNSKNRSLPLSANPSLCRRLGRDDAIDN